MIMVPPLAWPALGFVQKAGDGLEVLSWCLVADRPSFPPGRLTVQRVGMCAAAALVAMAAGAEAFVAISREATAVRYEAIDRSAQAIEIRDAQGRWLGVVPPGMEAAAAHPDGRTRHIVLAPHGVPSGWWTTLVALEDRHLGSSRSWRGVDLVAIGRAAVLAPIGLTARGGSSIAMQLVRVMNGRPPVEQGLFAKLPRKALELVDGPRVYAAFGGQDDQRFRRLVARHLGPLVIGERGSRLGIKIHGVELAARVLWRKPSSELSLAEQAILAAAVNIPIRLAPEDSAHMEEAEQRWRAVVARAQRGLLLAYERDNAQVQHAITQLEAMPLPRPRLEPDFRAAASGDITREFELAANPIRRIHALFRAPVVSALADVVADHGPAYGGRVTAVELGLDAGANLRFERAIGETLTVVERVLGARLLLPLVGRGQAAADIGLAIVDSAGVIRHVFVASERPLINGSRPGADRQIGSVGKALLAPVLADGPETIYCDPAPDELAECTATIPAIAAFARSANGPLLWRAAQLPRERLAEIAEFAQIQLDPGASPATGLTLGFATARPVELVAAFQALANGAAGAPAMAQRPRIVVAYEIREHDGTLRREDAARHPGINLSPSFLDPRSGPFTRAVLAAPLHRGGTLAGLAPASGRVSFAIGKSGTTMTPSGDVRDKLAVGAVVPNHGGKAVGFVGLIGTPDPRRPLGQSLGWAPFQPLLAVLVAFAVEEADRATARAALVATEASGH